jgi:hypothetical protein
VLSAPPAPRRQPLFDLIGIDVIRIELLTQPIEGIPMLPMLGVAIGLDEVLVTEDAARVFGRWPEPILGRSTPPWLPLPRSLVGHGSASQRGRNVPRCRASPGALYRWPEPVLGTCFGSALPTRSRRAYGWAYTGPVTEPRDLEMDAIERVLERQADPDAHDRSLIVERLSWTPEQRLEANASFLRFYLGLRPDGPLIRE